MANIEIDPGAGFCFGVDQVIKTAESYLERGEEIFGLGEMVHNASEVNRLEKLGLKTIGHHDLISMPPGKVLFRAHGEPPSTYQMAEAHQMEIIDGTCPIVSRLQKKVKKAYQSLDRATEQLVIYGKPDHPETIGLLGQVDGDAVVISSLEEISNTDPAKSIYLFSQTTMDPDGFKEVEERLKHQIKESVREQTSSSFRADCTICGQMKKRKPGLSLFVKRHDMILFVSGKNSSNGRMLYEFCRKLNPQTHWISNAEEIDKDWLKDVGSIGISGATSTSMRQLESISQHVEKLTSS